MMCRTVVILVNYKGAQDTAICLRSLHESEVVPRVVLVDNTPNDLDLADVIREYPDVHLIRAPENLGFGVGNNLGIEWALSNTDCEYFFILNNDAAVRPEAIKQLEAAMDRHPEAGIVTARIVMVEDPSRLWYGGGEVDWKRGGGSVPGWLGKADAPLAMRSRHVTFASGCAMIIRKKILQVLVGFDARYFMYEEDLELSLRIQNLGWKIWYESSALIHHVGQGSQKKGTAFVGRYDPRNPNLSFLVYHGMKNSLLNAHLHAKGKDKFMFRMFFPLVVSHRVFQWAIHGRIDALKSLVKALHDYQAEKQW
jgi:GT2 family glycosyltransferase